MAVYSFIYSFHFFILLLRVLAAEFLLGDAKMTTRTVLRRGTVDSVLVSGWENTTRHCLLLSQRACHLLSRLLQPSGKHRHFSPTLPVSQ